MLAFRLSAQRTPQAKRVTDVVVTRYEHVLEVDPKLMRKHVRQQEMPNWDVHRIVAARWEHIRDIHEQWADSIVLAGQGSELDDEPPASRAGDSNETTRSE
jgi:hypothetical protein